MTPDEVLRLKPPQKRGDGAQERIVTPGQMLVFVSGHHPILGTQMLYFLDPALNSRAELAPPTGFITLEDGKPVPQHTLNRTRNLVSKPELVSSDEPFSGVERHLVEELHVEQGEQ
jgi:type IV secretion system protein VirD4